jgi:hypothetical protein
MSAVVVLHHHLQSIMGCADEHILRRYQDVPPELMQDEGAKLDAHSANDSGVESHG